MIAKYKCGNNDENCKIDFEKGEATFTLVSLMPGTLYNISISTFFFDPDTNSEVDSELNYISACTSKLNLKFSVFKFYKAKWGNTDVG